MDILLPVLEIVIDVDQDFEHIFITPNGLLSMSISAMGEFGGGFISLMGSPNMVNFFLLPENTVVLHSKSMRSVASEDLACKYFRVKLLDSVNPNLSIVVTMNTVF